jgi:hypothetical protein
VKVAYFIRKRPCAVAKNAYFLHKNYAFGWVASSRLLSHIIACSRVSPHISKLGCKLAQNAGRPCLPKIMQRFSSSSCTQRTPAGLPLGMPGIGLLMEGAMLHAPQLDLHCIFAFAKVLYLFLQFKL